MKKLEMFEAFDGTRFDDAEACKAYEAQHAEGRLVGLTLDQIKAALARTDVELADVLEDIGARIARTRRASGDMRRHAKGAPKEPTPDGGASEPVAATEPAAATPADDEPGAEPTTEDDDETRPHDAVTSRDPDTMADGTASAD